MDDRQALLALEERRCQAIGDGNGEVLREILTPDYVHVHATGKIDDLAGHIETITSRPRKSERNDLTVRIYGDTAVLVGEQLNRMGDEVMSTVATQVALRQDGRWRFVSMQVTRKPD